MKMQKMFLSAVLIAMAACFFVACGGDTAAADTATEAVETVKPAPKKAAAEEGPEYTSAYICPMHCAGSGSAQAGKCPVCNMDYVANENHNSHDGHDHSGHDHSGHDHSGHDHSGHNH